MTMPNFLIVGAAKAGTTSLLKYVEQHPEIYMCPVESPRFFNVKGSEKSPYGDLDAYQSLFDGVINEKAIGEKSTTYLANPRVPGKIKEYLPDVKLIAVLRNPVDRAYSQFNYYLREGQEDCTDFATIAARDIERVEMRKAPSQYTSWGMYSVHLERYLKFFDKSQIKLVIFEEFVREPDRVMAEVFEFLGVDPDAKVDTSKQHNVTTAPKGGIAGRMLKLVARNLDQIKRGLIALAPDWLYRRVIVPTGKSFLDLLRSSPSKPAKLDPAVRDRLMGVFRDDISRLERLIGKDFSTWSNASSEASG